MLRVGMLVDNCYKIVKELGRGGTSCVFLAENIRLHNYRAIKEIYKNSLVDGFEGENLLKAETALLTKLNHPRFPSIIDVLDTPESYLIVMEYVEGVSLDKVVKDKGACSQDDVLKWGQQICEVLDYLHNQQPAIIYRDMKPANVMLKPDNNIVVIDFGMAREYKLQNQHDTTNLGTQGYAAPEQYSGEKQSDARTDIYNLGMTLYHLVTGKHPLEDGLQLKTICQINPSLSRDLDRIIKKCTEYKPEDRFQTAEELSKALKSVNKNNIGPVEDLDTDDGETKPKSLKWMWSLLAIPVVLIVTLLVIIFTNGSSAGVANSDAFFEQEVTIEEGETRECYAFVPTKSGYYKIYSESDDVIPVVWLKDKDSNAIDSNNTNGKNKDFYLRTQLEAGETYHLETALSSADPSAPQTGTFRFYIEAETE